MLLRVFSALLLLLTVLLAPACRSRQERHAADRRAVPSEADDVARFLAGLPGRGVSPFKPLESDPAWKAHAGRLNGMFRDYEERRLPAMREFAREELSRREDLQCPVFYPFSGADALTMLAFFPGRRMYVMAALEPPGRVPGTADLPPEKLEPKLLPLADTLASLLRKSFFVTREMDRQLRGQITDGVAEPLLIQLARAGYGITGHEYVQLDAQGRVVRRPEDVRRAEFGHNRGLRLELIDPDGRRPATLVYISLNLDDAHLRSNTPFVRFVNGLGAPCTMLKATSYMLHDRSFTRIRTLILERSALILQDDSGIPWRFLASGGWDVQLYGEYEKPYGKSFQFRAQPDLRAAYDDPRRRVKPLKFRIGYGAGRVASNLQVARRTRAGR
ncbi:MAG: hypothetical protein N2036_12375 [Bryobacteraceae bacterium]|nr:hypothetical protein [Bryobacteraceae bacterium]